MKNKKLTIDLVRNIAKQKNGKLLSTTYVNIDSKLKWECDVGHQWEASFYSIKKLNSWCPHCAGVAKRTLEDMKVLAKKKDGKCLSTKYINSSQKLLWECEFGHQWEACYSPIKHSGIWCPYCSGKKKLTLEDMHKLAKSRNGKCLSKEYKNNDTKLTWECVCGYKWEATPSSVKNNGSWCPKCANNLKFTMEYMNELARNKSGKCLSMQYKDIYSKLEWQCQYGHQWHATPRDVQDGKWCKKCYGSKRRGENAVRHFFELIFNNKFPSSRPEWLLFEGKKLELDGYCESIRIAFEYQGLYHVDEKAYWYPDKSVSFERRQLLDAHKRKLCAKNNVTLIEIPELNVRKIPEDWKNTIRELLTYNRIKIPSNFDLIPFGAHEFYNSKNYLEEAHAIAESRQGFCRSNAILYVTQGVEWECKNKHKWTASLCQIKSKNTWCPYCAGKAKLTIDEIHEIAKARGGKCLSNEYVNAKTKLKWECKFGHQWMAIPSSIKNHGTWCHVCNGNNVYTIKGQITYLPLFRIL